MSESDRKKWYLVYTKPRQEVVARTNLERQQYTVYLPQIWNKPKNKPRQVVPMFPRYLFIHLDRTTDNWGPIRSTLGVVSVVRFGMAPTVVPDAVLDLIRGREGEEGVIEYVGHEFRKGDPIRVKDGVFQGIEGIFLAKTGGERVAVLLKIMGQSSRTVISDAEIEPSS